MFDNLLVNQAAINAFDRSIYTAAYNRPEGIGGGNGWYATFVQDIADGATYGKVKAPILGLVNSLFYPNMAAVLPTRGTDVTVHEVTNTGHYFVEERPQVVIDEFTRVLRLIGDRGVGASRVTSRGWQDRLIPPAPALFRSLGRQAGGAFAPTGWLACRDGVGAGPRQDLRRLLSMASALPTGARRDRARGTDTGYPFVEERPAGRHRRVHRVLQLIGDRSGGTTSRTEAGAGRIN